MEGSTRTHALFQQSTLEQLEVLVLSRLTEREGEGCDQGAVGQAKLGMGCSAAMGLHTF